MSKLVSQVLPLSSQHPQYKGLHLHRSIVFTHFSPLEFAHMYFLMHLFLKQSGAPNYIDVMLYAACVSSELTYPYGQVRRVYITSNLMLKGFCPRTWSNVFFFQSGWFFIGSNVYTVTALFFFMFSCPAHHAHNFAKHVSAACSQISNL